MSETSKTRTKTKSVVINDCYGGFSLSPEGEAAYLARKGETPHFYVNVRGEDGRIDFHKHTRWNPEADERPFVTFTLLDDVGDEPDDEALNAGRWFNDRDIKRDDPDLVAVVQELGEKAAGAHAQLKIVEIPDDVEFTIHEYDGLEHVAEAHRTWA